MAIGLIIGAGLAIGSAIMGDKAKDAQNRARRDQLQANRVRNFQAKRQFLQNFRVAQAEALARGIAGGVDVSSSFGQATAASQGTQTATASRDFAELSRLGESASSNLNKAANASFGAGLFSTAAGFAMSDAGQSLIGNLGSSTPPSPKPPVDFQGRPITYG